MTLGTVTDLQATPGTTPNELCRLLGYYIPGDGGGGDFYWDAASTETPNGGTIFSTGTTGRWKRLIEGPLNVRWFGAKGDDIADDTAAFTAAIKCNGDIRKEIDVPAGTYKINSTVYLPRWTTLKGNGAVIKGGNIFETGYFDATGTVISNASQLPDTDPKRCIDLKISGFTFEGVNNAFTLNNFEEGSFVTDCMFLSCTSCIRSRNAFYSSFHRLICRGTQNIAEPAFSFVGFISAISFDQVFTAGRDLGLYVDGVFSFKIMNSSFEGCKTGVYMNGRIEGLELDTCYFENTAIGINSNANAKHGVIVKNCWFAYISNVCITGSNYLDSRIYNNTVDENVNKFCSVTDYESNTLSVEMPYSLYPALSVFEPRAVTKIDISPYTLLSNQDIRFYGPTGLPVAVANANLTRPVTMNFYGRPYLIPDNVVPFTTRINSGTTTNSTASFLTQIEFVKHAMLAYSFECSDNNGTYNFSGLIIGNTVIPMVSSPGKSFTISNDGGYYRVTIGIFTHPSVYPLVNGVIRII